MGATDVELGISRFMMRGIQRWRYTHGCAEQGEAERARIIGVVIFLFGRGAVLFLNRLQRRKFETAKFSLKVTEKKYFTVLTFFDA